MGRTLSSLIWSSFIKIQAIIGGSVFLAGLFWVFSPETLIPSKLAVPILIILLLIIITLFNSTYESFNISQKILPSVLYSGKSDNESVRCLLEPSELFSQNSLVSFHYRDEADFEVLIGIGIVEIIRDSDHIIQVNLTNYISSYKEIITKMKNSDPIVIKRVHVKPHIPLIPYQYLQEMRRE